MAEYKIKGGHAISDEEIEHLGEACDDGDYPGELGEWIVRPEVNREMPDRSGSAMHGSVESSDLRRCQA